MPEHYDHLLDSKVNSVITLMNFCKHQRIELTIKGNTFKCLLPCGSEMNLVVQDNVPKTSLNHKVYTLLHDIKKLLRT